MRHLIFRLLLCLALVPFAACSQTALPMAPAPYDSTTADSGLSANGATGQFGPAGDDHRHGHFVEGDAVVTSLVAGTSCPTLSFVAEEHTIKTTAATMYSSGTCADIRPGRRLTIQGTMGAGGVVTASHIVLKGDHPTEVEGNTTIKSLVAGTSCPTLSFVTGHHTIKTDASTIYVGGTCADLKVGVRLQIKGLKLADGTIAATRIKFKHEDDDQDDDDD